MSKTGANIFSGKIDLETNTVKPSDADVLFAGFISAILSVSEELQNSDIRELGYQENKIVFTLTENLIFLGFVDTKVPNDDIETLLDEVVRKWMNNFDDDEYPFVPNEMRDKILDIVQSSIRDVFWWAAPNFNVRNNIKYINSAITKPSGSYFVQYLPNTYLLTSGIILAMVMLGSYLSGVAFIGFASGPPRSGGTYQVRAATAITLLMFTVGIALLLKLFYRNQFNFRAFIMTSMIYSIFLLFVILFTTNFWLNGVYDIALDAVRGNLILQYAVDMFVFFAPFNTAFFGYIILTGYATSNNQMIPIKQYMGAYLLCILLVISISQFISSALLGVMPY